MLEKNWWQQGLKVAGVDEVGRGALAGPVVVAAVILRPGDYPFRDSKTLTAKQRENLEPLIKRVALAWALGRAEVEEIEEVGINEATRRAAIRALEQLTPDAVITDCLRIPFDGPFLCPAKADRDSVTVAAASIIAKVARDREMNAIHEQCPNYGFIKHKGYGTPFHLQALRKFGPSKHHRKSFLKEEKCINTNNAKSED